ncbi:hypothetical protein BOX15_Mlig005368g1 [Macrostomum lignano]|uniref:Uncharacterized protein n=1 Tax=Macrostomum lignano TaxID=282301 RepID=A0A267FB04_9PLAT|nr:hypothetical protein BOX15_Mlig005368g1 [Macrostomum lignano]
MGLASEVDDFLLHSSGNTLQLCTFAILLLFPGAAGLFIVGGAFLADVQLRAKYSWLLPCSVVMTCLGAALLVVGSTVIARLCRSHRRQQRLRMSRQSGAAAGHRPLVTPAGWQQYRTVPSSTIVQV